MLGWTQESFFEFCSSAFVRFRAVAGTPRHGTARRTRRFMARHGTENLGTENLGTARHGKSWHGKILARHGTKNHARLTNFHYVWTNKNPENHISELSDFQKISPYSSGDHFSESCSPRKMMQNRVDEIFWGQTFKNTSYFTSMTSGSLLPGS